MYNILCLITPGDSTETVACLLYGLAELAKAHQNPKAEAGAIDVKLPEIPLLALTPRDSFYGDVELIPFAQSAGRIMAESVYVYPPGIPILLPGEVIAEQHIRYIHEHLEVGLPVKRTTRFNCKNIKVVIEARAKRGASFYESQRKKKGFLFHSGIRASQKSDTWWGK